jgi:hypothetical protein
MARQKQNLEKVTLRLEAGTIEAIQEFYPKAGYNVVIRKVMSDYVRKLKAKYNTQRSQDDDELDSIQLDDIPTD